VRAVASGPDAAPDLAVAMCAVDAAFARFTVPVLPVEAIDAETGRLLHNAVLRAAACVPCNHKARFYPKMPNLLSLNPLAQFTLMPKVLHLQERFGF
jgi:hypothetical protein